MGVMSVGVMGVGVMSVGVMSVGVTSVGVTSVGVMSVGVMSVGVMGVGVMSVGVMSVGVPFPPLAGGGQGWLAREQGQGRPTLPTASARAQEEGRQVLHVQGSRHGGWSLCVVVMPTN